MKTLVLNQPCSRKWLNGWLGQKNLEYGIWNLESGIWKIFDGWVLESGFWNLESGFWNMESGFLESGFWNLKSDLWNLDFRNFLEDWEKIRKLKLFLLFKFKFDDVIYLSLSRILHDRIEPR